MTTDTNVRVPCDTTKTTDPQYTTITEHTYFEIDRYGVDPTPYLFYRDEDGTDGVYRINLLSGEKKLFGSVLMDHERKTIWLMEHYTDTKEREIKYVSFFKVSKRHVSIEALMGVMNISKSLLLDLPSIYPTALDTI